MIQTRSIAYKPRAWQLEAHALLSKHRFTVLVCHRRAGKTFLACASLIMSALARPGTRYAYVAPYRNQAKNITWQVFKDMLRNIPGVVFKEADLIIEFPNGAQIGLFSGERHDSMRGLGLDGVVLDETAMLDFEAWHASIRPTLSGTGGWGLVLGTPNGPSLLSELHHYATSGADCDWCAATYPAWPENSTGVLCNKEVEAARSESISDATFRREYGCDLTVGAEDQVVRLEDVIACQARVAPHSLVHDPGQRGQPRILGIDVGGGTAAGDNSVIALRWGHVILDPIIVAPERHEELAIRVANEARKHAVDAIFVDGTGGWSSHLIPSLQAMGLSPIPVNFGAASLKPELYANRRAELHAELGRFVKLPTTILPTGQKLAAELTATRFSHDAKGRVLLEPKKEVRARLGRSPDMADAIALTFAAPIFVANSHWPQVSGALPGNTATDWVPARSPDYKFDPFYDPHPHDPYS